MVKQFLTILFYDPDKGWTKEQMEKAGIEKEVPKQRQAKVDEK